MTTKKVTKKAAKPAARKTAPKKAASKKAASKKATTKTVVATARKTPVPTGLTAARNTAKKQKPTNFSAVATPNGLARMSMKLTAKSVDKISAHALKLGVAYQSFIRQIVDDAAAKL